MPPDTACSRLVGFVPTFGLFSGSGFFFCSRSKSQPAHQRLTQTVSATEEGTMPTVYPKRMHWAGSRTFTRHPASSWCRSLRHLTESGPRYWNHCSHRSWTWYAEGRTTFGCPTSSRPSWRVSPKLSSSRPPPSPTPSRPCALTPLAALGFLAVASRYWQPKTAPGFAHSLIWNALLSNLALPIG